MTELLQGETLRQKLADGPVPLATALDWASQIARGLAAAHARGIVHRDLKPENLFATRDGQLKLLDFGIAKLTEAVRNQGARDLMSDTASSSGGQTGTGVTIGSPSYMSPEQVRGGPVDARTDSFALGAVLYEMLSGRRAFPGATFLERNYATLHHDPQALPDTVPPNVAQIVRRCLEKEPDRRFQSASDLAFALDGLRTPMGEGGPSPVSSPGWAHRTRWLVGGTLAALTLAFALDSGSQAPSRPQSPHSFGRGSGDLPVGNDHWRTVLAGRTHRVQRRIRGPTGGAVRTSLGKSERAGAGRSGRPVCSQRRGQGNSPSSFIRAK